MQCSKTSVYSVCITGMFLQFIEKFTVKFRFNYYCIVER